MVDPWQQDIHLEKVSFLVRRLARWGDILGEAVVILRPSCPQQPCRLPLLQSQGQDQIRLDHARRTLLFLGIPEVEGDLWGRSLHGEDSHPEGDSHLYRAEGSLYFREEAHYDLCKCQELSPRQALGPSAS